MLRRTLPLVLALALGAIACSDDSSGPTNPSSLPDDAIPAFSLTDVNPTSATADEAVSPRDHLRRVSAWYFGHAT